MYIGAWQEYRLANAFTQPSESRHAQLTDFYSKWQKLCDQEGEQAATKALIFDPLFASVAGQQQQRAQSCYQLEQGPSSDPSSSSSTWRLEHGNGQPSAVEIRGKSAGAATTGRRRRGQEFVRQGVRTVQKRKENYMKKRSGGGAVVPRSAPDSKKITSGPRRIYPEMNGVENMPPHIAATAPTSTPSTTTSRLPSFTTQVSSTTVSERVLTAKPSRYITAATSNVPQQYSKHIPTLEFNQTSNKLPHISLSNGNGNATTMRTATVTTASQQLQNQQFQQMQYQQQVPQQQQQQHYNNNTSFPQQPISFPPQPETDVSYDYIHSPLPSTPLQQQQQQQQPSQSVLPLQSTSPLQINTNDGRPPTSPNRMSSPVWEEEVDELLKWTEGLEDDHDPLDVSMSDGLLLDLTPTK